MAKRSSFRPYRLDQSARQNLSVKRFLGVDYSTQKFLISDGHAIDMKNLVYRDGVVQKRHGLEQVLQAEPVDYVPASFEDPSVPAEEIVKSNGVNFNGIWDFVAEDGDRHIVCHVGCLLFEVKGLGTDRAKLEPISFGVRLVGSKPGRLCHEFLNIRSFAYVGGRKLWFQGGNKYMVLRFLKGEDGSRETYFRPVANNLDIVPIPTTMRSITYKNSIASQRMPLDAVNVMTMWRKNMLLSGTTKSETDTSVTENYEYVLDAPLVVRDAKDMADFEIIVKESGKIGG